MVNNVVLVGRITKDLELKQTNSGIPFVQFTVAVDRGIKDANGERQADFINCVAWRQTADFMSRYIKKGYMISVQGRITTRSYQVEGQTRYVTEVVCDSVNNLQPRDSAPSNTYQPQTPRESYNNTNTYKNNYSQGGYSNQGYQAPQKNTVDNNFERASFDVNDISEDDLPF